MRHGESRGYQMIEAADTAVIVENVRHGGQITNPRHARELAPLAKEDPVKAAGVLKKAKPGRGEDGEIAAGLIS